jgi:hypothetical protein
MNLLDKFSQWHQFEINWQRQLLQGAVILLTGFTFALASVLQSEAVIMSATYYSWLPVCGIIILTLADRIFNCPICGLSKDRDLNASENILQQALRVSSAIRTQSKCQSEIA